jgi:hypothetical protein
MDLDTVAADLDFVNPLAPDGAFSVLDLFGTGESFAALHQHSHLFEQEEPMAVAMKTTARGRKQDRARVAGGQDYEVKYESKKTGRSVPAVKKAVKKVGNARKPVEKRLGR